MPAEHPFGINIVGPDRGTEYGVGEAALQLSRAVAASGLDHLHVDVGVQWRDGERHLSVATPNPYSVNLLTINGFDAWILRRDVDASFFEDRLNVAKWYLEVAPMPDWMRPALGLVDEVWVATEHVRGLIEPVSPVPVTVIAPSVAAPQATGIGRSELGIADGFLFLHVFDLNSSIERKNPLDLIEAYKRAFEPGEGAGLYIKAGNPQNRPDRMAQLEAAADGRPDIQLSARHLSGPERDALIAACDCYVSLHRAEGFGFTMPEAMLAAKPVIATRYSGNLDYMTDDNSLLVDQELVPVGEAIDLYPAAGMWAQADVDHAARLMRWAFDHPDQARSIGERAQADARRMFDPATAGVAIERRLRARLGANGGSRSNADSVA